MKTARVPEPNPPDVRPSRFSRVVLKTANLLPMAAWYKTVLNADPDDMRKRHREGADLGAYHAEPYE